MLAMHAAAPILVAAEADETSDEAIRQADARARLNEVPLCVRTVIPDVLRVSPMMPTAWLTFDLSHLRAHAESSLRERVARVTRRAPESIDIGVLEGAPHAAIVTEAERIGAGLIVVGSHGRHGVARLILGSVAERVVRYAGCPVLVARPRTLAGHVLAATDFSDAALPAVRAGVEEAASKKGRLTVIHCIDVAELDGVRSALGGPPGPLSFSAASLDQMRQEAEARIATALSTCGGSGDARVLDGRPAHAILQVAKELDVELIVVGTSGRTGLRRVALGSVAEAVVRDASTSVLVVRLDTQAASER